MLQTPEMLNVYMGVLAPFPSNLKNTIILTRADVFIVGRKLAFSEGDVL